MTTPRPRSLYLELFVDDLAHHVAILRDALGFEIVSEPDDEFVKLATSDALVMLNAERGLDADHPFANIHVGAKRGLGVEIVFVVLDLEDLEAAHASIARIEGCAPTAIVAQEWGMSDFRVTTRDGYYFRVTAPSA